jgi:hypothetical protein
MVALSAPPVPPHLVARVARPGEEIARRQVVDRDTVRLPHHDPVASHRLAVRSDGAEGLGGGVRAALPVARLGAVDHDAGAAHAAQVHVGRGDHDPAVVPVGRIRGLGAVRRLVVVPGCHEDPVARFGRVDGRLDRREPAGVTVERPHEQHLPAGRHRRGARRGRGAAGGQQAGSEDAGTDGHGPLAQPVPAAPVDDRTPSARCHEAPPTLPHACAPARPECVTGRG